jgi:putative acetyltransferase
MMAERLPVTIRSERAGEEAVVRRIVERSFHAEPAVAALVDALRDSWAWIDGLSFIAEHEATAVGHLLVTSGLLDAPRRLVDVLVLSPLGVVPEHQARQVGSRLMRR